MHDQPPAPGAYLRVNEARIFATRTAADYWVLYRYRQPPERLTVITATIVGDLLDVACDSREDAEWLASDLIDRGVPHTALTVHKA